MSKVGIATLPLHRAKAPAWLFKRMVILAKPIFKIIYDMEGSEGILRKFNELKENVIRELIDDKVKIEKEKLKAEMEEDLFKIFEHLGVPKDRLIQIMEIIK